MNYLTQYIACDKDVIYSYLYSVKLFNILSYDIIHL